MDISLPWFFTPVELCNHDTSLIVSTGWPSAFYLNFLVPYYTLHLFKALTLGGKHFNGIRAKKWACQNGMKHLWMHHWIIHPLNSFKTDLFSKETQLCVALFTPGIEMWFCRSNHKWTMLNRGINGSETFWVCPLSTTSRGSRKLIHPDCFHSVSCYRQAPFCLLI